MSIKKNLPLIFGIAIPVLMVLFVAASVYLPGLFIQPKYNFVYAIGRPGEYIVNDNKISDPSAPPSEPWHIGQTGKLYKYNTAKNESSSITLEEAKMLKLDSNTKSPDGFEVANGGYGSGFPFFYSGSSYDTLYLRGHNVSRKLNLPQGSGMYYPYNFQFVGWELQ